MKKIITLIAALVLSGCSAYEVKSGERVPAPRGQQFSNIPALAVKQAAREAHGLFTYKSDKDEEWTSYGLEMIHGLPFKGDCEDFALTVADYLETQGYDARHMAIAVLNVSYIVPSDTYNHAVLIVNTDEGQLVVDNMSKRAVSVNFYDSASWYSMRRLDTEEWRRVEIKNKGEKIAGGGV